MVEGHNSALTYGLAIVYLYIKSLNIFVYLNFLKPKNKSWSLGVDILSTSHSVR